MKKFLAITAFALLSVHTTQSARADIMETESPEFRMVQKDAAVYFDEHPNALTAIVDQPGIVMSIDNQETNDGKSGDDVIETLVTNVSSHTCKVLVADDLNDPKNKEAGVVVDGQNAQDIGACDDSETATHNVALFGTDPALKSLVDTH